MRDKAKVTPSDSFSSAEIISKLDSLQALIDSHPTTQNKIEPIIHNNVIPILVIACDRVQVKRTLESIFRIIPKNDRFPVIVSQDCNHEETSKVIQEFADKLIHLKHPMQPDPVVKEGHERLIGYYKLSRHFKWALHQVFDILYFHQVIVLEDDMELAVDFFDYFEAFLPVLRADDTLYCISAWNDNGLEEFVEDPTVFFRTDFFPGLGWMMTRTLWLEIGHKWPNAFWDDWMREPEQRKGRSCIRPEISRTSNFGENGVSGGLFFNDYIARIHANQEPVTYTGFDKTSLLLKPLRTQVSDSPLTASDIINSKESHFQSVDVRLFIKSLYDPIFLHQVYQFSSKIGHDQLHFQYQPAPSILSEPVGKTLNSKDQTTPFRLLNHSSYIENKNILVYNWAKTPPSPIFNFLFTTNLRASVFSNFVPRSFHKTQGSSIFSFLNWLITDDVHELDLLKFTWPISPHYVGRTSFRRFVVPYYYEYPVANERTRLLMSHSRFVDPPLEDLNKHGYEVVTKWLKSWNLMDDVRAGLMRCSYLGVVCFKLKLNGDNEMELWDHSEVLEIKSDSSTSPKENEKFSKRKKKIIKEKFISICYAPTLSEGKRKVMYSEPQIREKLDF